MTLEEAMDAALEQARFARDLGEVPIGAVVLLDGAIVGRGHNRTIVDRDPVAHAEIVALRDAARAVGNHRMTGAVLVSTLEPCLMCCGAAVHARVEALAYAADDPKAGGVELLRASMDAGKVNHRVRVERGPRGEESGDLLRVFFQARRKGGGAERG